MQDSFRYWAFWKPEIWLKWILMETQKIDSSFYSRFFRCLCKDLTCWQNILHCLLCSLLVAGLSILLGNESLGLNTDLVCCWAMRFLGTMHIYLLCCCFSPKWGHFLEDDVTEELSLQDYQYWKVYWGPRKKKQWTNQ